MSFYKSSKNHTLRLTLRGEMGCCAAWICLKPQSKTENSLRFEQSWKKNWLKDWSADQQWAISGNMINLAVHSISCDHRHSISTNLESEKVTQGRINETIPINQSNISLKVYRDMLPLHLTRKTMTRHENREVTCQRWGKLCRLCKLFKEQEAYGDRRYTMRISAL